MNDRGKIIKIKEKTIPFYYEYILINKLNKKYHLVYIDSENFKLLIPSYYQIDYSKSVSTYSNRGYLYFYNNKYSYTLDYMKMDYQSFRNKISKIKNNITKSFVNYRSQEIYEVLKDNIDYIYMYYQGYLYILYSNHRYTINEYFDMYVILFSITDLSFNKEINHIKELCYLQDQGIYYLCNDLDLLLIDLARCTNNIDIKQDDLFIDNDEDYIKYKDTMTKAQDLALKLLEPNRDLSLIFKDNNWYLNGIFSFGILGKYDYGYAVNYDEITSSDELSISEKTDLLGKIINQKQLEVMGYIPKIKSAFYKYLIGYLKENISYDIWCEFHIREFINIDYLTDNECDINDNMIYKIFINRLNNDNNTIAIFNLHTIEKSIIGHKIIIYPNQYIISFSALNSFLNDQEYIVSEDYNLCNNNC